MNFNKIVLQNGDWFDRTEFTLAQIEVIKDSYSRYSHRTFRKTSNTLLLFSGGSFRGYTSEEIILSEEYQLHPADFFPVASTPSLEEDNHTKEAQTLATEAPVDSEEGLRFVESSAEIVPLSSAVSSVKACSEDRKKLHKQLTQELTLSHLESFILSHNASMYLKPEEGGFVYMIYMEDEDEYKIETKEDLDKLSGALDVLKEMRV